MLENVGYRQLILFFRFQGVLKFLVGSHRWEKVIHKGESLSAGSTNLAATIARASAGKID